MNAISGMWRGSGRNMYVLPAELLWSYNGTKNTHLILIYAFSVNSTCWELRSANRLRAGCPCLSAWTDTRPAYLADERHLAVNSDTRQHLRSSTSPSLIVRRSRLSTVGDRAFPVAGTRSIPGTDYFDIHIKLPVFIARLKTYSHCPFA